MTLGEVFNSTSVQLKEMACWAYNHPREAITNKKTLLSSLAFVSIAACAYALKNQKYAFSGLVITSLCTFTYVVYRKNIDSDEGPEDNDQVDTIPIIGERPEDKDQVDTIPIIGERPEDNNRFNPIEAMISKKTSLSSSSLAFALIVACAHALKNQKCAFPYLAIVSLVIFTCLAIASLATSDYVVYRKNIDHEGHKRKFKGTDVNLPIFYTSCVSHDIAKLKQFTQFLAESAAANSNSSAVCAAMAKVVAQRSAELAANYCINADNIINTMRDNESDLSFKLIEDAIKAKEDAEDANKLAKKAQASADQFSDSKAGSD
ncbi:MAG: hypothetical protein ACOVOR_03985 [Rhabdochlamydiaceae bacterium]